MGDAKTNSLLIHGSVETETVLINPPLNLTKLLFVTFIGFVKTTSTESE